MAYGKTCFLLIARHHRHTSISLWMLVKSDCTHITRLRMHAAVSVSPHGAFPAPAQPRLPYRLVSGDSRAVSAASDVMFFDE